MRLHNTVAAHETHPPATTGRLIRWANLYDPFTSVLMLGRRSQLRRETVALAHIQPSDQVLEVGCGTGDVALAASAQIAAGGSVVGIDPAPEMIAVARRKAQARGSAATFHLGVIEALPFPDRSFDVVLSSLMMHHLPDDLKRDGLAEIARVLKPGGRLLVVDIKRPRRRLEHVVSALMMHAHIASGIHDLAPLLSAAGFTQIESGATSFRMLGFVRAAQPAVAISDHEPLG